MNENATTLDRAEQNKSYIVVSISGGDEIKKRLLSMGFVPSAVFQVLSSGSHGPVTVMIKGTRIALGRGIAGNIHISEKEGNGKKELVVALAGNPNSGKTTIFNSLTGQRQHVGNYPGVTVETKEGICSYKNYTIRIIDLPGTYSLTPYSMEELVSRNFILNENPDVVVDVLDCSNLERNLYLATQFMEMQVPLILVFNKSDLTTLRGEKVDVNILSNLLGAPIVETIGHKGIGMERILETIVDVAEKCIVARKVTIGYGKELELEIEKIEALLQDSRPLVEKYNLRWLAVKVLEKDSAIRDDISKSAGNAEKIFSTAEKSGQIIKNIFGDSLETIMADKRYGFISGAHREASVLTVDDRHTVSDQIDRILTHRIIGIPFFVAVMWLIFYLTFSLGEYPVHWIELAFKSAGDFLGRNFPDGPLKSLLADGIIGGVGGVVSFLPSIMILFLGIAFLEDSGYMARAAFIMDHLMHKIGLHGKSFIPLLIGYGCTVPAYMASRTLESRKDRLITMHITTFMSCNARIPVYVLIIGTFWPEHSASVMFALYFLGATIAIISAKLLRKARFRGESAPFVMELPPYRMPTLKGMFVHMWDRAWMYLRKAGTLILGFSVLLWFLTGFPKDQEFQSAHAKKMEEYRSALDKGQMDRKAFDAAAEKAGHEKAAEELGYSFAGRAGKMIEPLLRPLGFDWKTSVAVFSGFAAKEIVVSTLGTFYSVESASGDSEPLREHLRKDPAFTPLVGLSLMVFILLMFPCVSALAVFYRESGSLQEVLFQMTYTTALAWIMSFIVYQGGRLLGFS
jgi:ferrous iron transport protein B